jgi:hypothetical protein
MTTTTRTITAIALLAGLVPALLTGCSSSPGSGPDAGRSSSANESDKHLAVARCMRDRGHEMTDDGGAKIDQSTMQGSWSTDLAECQRKAGVQVAVPTLSAADRQKQLEYATCMRERGVSDYPDPSDDPNEVTRYDGAHVDEFNAAAKTCDSKVYADGYQGGGAEAGQP